MSKTTTPTTAADFRALAVADVETIIAGNHGLVAGMADLAWRLRRAATMVDTIQSMVEMGFDLEDDTYTDLMDKVANAVDVAKFAKMTASLRETARLSDSAVATHRVSLAAAQALGG